MIQAIEAEKLDLLSDSCPEMSEKFANQNSLKKKIFVKLPQKRPQLEVGEKTRVS